MAKESPVSEICEVVEASATFKPDVCEKFWFPDVKEGEKVTDSWKTECRHCRCCAILGTPAGKSIPCGTEEQIIDGSPQTTGKEQIRGLTQVFEWL